MSDAPVDDPIRQQLLFGWLRWRQLRHFFRQACGQSALRPLSILSATFLVIVFVFLVSHEGFLFLLNEVKVPLSGGIVGTLIDLLFMTLGILLVFSCGLMLYSSLFTSAETAFLLSRPLADDQIFSYKLQSAVGFSSWAFLLLGGPVLIAYGVVAAAPWYFYPLLLLFFLGFILIPGAVGGLFCLLTISYVPRRRKHLLAAVGGVLLVLLAVWIYRSIAAERPESWGRESVNRLLGRFGFARSELAPSHWVARGLQLAGRGEPTRAGYYLALVWSNGLFLYLLTAWAARRLYRPALDRLAGGGTLRRRHGGHWLDGIVARLLFFVHPGTRLLIIKDFRSFRRDPQQWGQILLFAGLMTLYLMNIRQVSRDYMGWKYLCTVSLLNVWVIALLTSIYTGRFVFPLLSLEGRKFWILGLMPLERDQLLWGKFTFSTCGAVLLGSLLTLLSDLSLGMPWPVLALHLFTVLVVGAGLSGLSVGLGACLASFRETDPFKVAVGFGGTVNLIVGLVFLLGVLTLLTLPVHLAMMAGGSFREVRFPWLVILLALAVGATIGVAAVVIPLRMGLHALRRMEF